MPKKKILVAPLNWGLGHATRCIPLIRELLVQNFEPVLASDGAALELLKQEFPLLSYYTLPSYNISYSQNPFFFRSKLLSQAPHIIRNIAAEKKVTAKIITNFGISGIISDNRWGVRSSRVPSVFVTHQFKVLSGITTGLSSFLHRQLIKNFDECWVPDNATAPQLSGKMGHSGLPGLPVKYLGALSRFKKEEAPVNYDLLMLLSGPEPQRSLLEELLIREFHESELRMLLVQGKVQALQKTEKKGNISICNYLRSEELQEALNSSKMVLCRSGYTNLLDLAALGKKAFLIPTPGQYEQEYLAARMKRKKLLMSCSQKEFSSEKLSEAENYKGLDRYTFTCAFAELFALFKRE